MLCLSASRAESLESLRSALAAVSPPDGLALVLGGPAVTPEIARDLRATYADGELDLAVARLRKLAIG